MPIDCIPTSYDYKYVTFSYIDPFYMTLEVFSIDSIELAHPNRIEKTDCTVTFHDEIDSVKELIEYAEGEQEVKMYDCEKDFQ